MTLETIGRDVFAAETRSWIDNHTDGWDGPHYFVPLRWEPGEPGRLITPTVVAIMPDIDPADYPDYMMMQAAEDMARAVEARGGPDIAGYLLMFEGYTVTADPAAMTPAEREQLHRDRIAHTFHTRADAVETASAYTADVWGRVYVASHTRASPGQVDELFIPPAGPGTGGARLNGRFMHALRVCAAAAGWSEHDIPLPPDMIPGGMPHPN